MDTTGTSAPDPPKSLTRSHLYDLAWSMPMSKLARSFGWSDVWLAKLCRQVGVPPAPPPASGLLGEEAAPPGQNQSRGCAGSTEPDAAACAPRSSGHSTTARPGGA